MDIDQKILDDMIQAVIEDRTADYYTLAHAVIPALSQQIYRDFFQETPGKA